MSYSGHGESKVPSQPQCYHRQQDVCVGNVTSYWCQYNCISRTHTYTVVLPLEINQRNTQLRVKSVGYSFEQKRVKVSFTIFHWITIESKFSYWKFHIEIIFHIEITLRTKEAIWALCHAIIKLWFDWLLWQPWRIIWRHLHHNDVTPKKKKGNHKKE